MMKKTAMIITLLCAMVQGVWAESVTFNVRSWDEVNKKVVTTPTDKPVTILSGTHENDWAGLTNGYYLVKSDTEYDVLNIMGDDVHIILSGGATLSCSHVKLEGSNKLHIHDISDDNTGTLKVRNAIRRIHSTFKTTQHPGSGTAQTRFIGVYHEAAAIGGGKGAHGGSFYVHGGTVDVLQSGTGAAIGGGDNAGIDGEVVVYAGTVDALVKSTEYSGAAIGGGNDHSQRGPVKIYGGKVKAVVYEETGSIKRNVGAGIGGGTNGGHGGGVFIWGGEVLAIGGEYGTGIGGGKKGKGGNVHIFGGTVVARGGQKCSAIGAYGDYDLGTIEFGDNMMVTGGSASRGSNYDELNPTVERVFTSGERIPACQWRKWVKIEVCNHTKPTEGSDTTDPFYYTIDNDDLHHTKHCRYCNATFQEEHSGATCVCGKESSYKFTVYEASTTKDTYVEGTTTTVGAGQTFLLPACSTVPEGCVFKGWAMNPDPESNKWAYVLGPGLIQPQESVVAKPGMDNAKFYPRFLYTFNPTWEWAADGSWAKVTLKHKDLSDVTLSSTDAEPKVVITQEDLKETATVVDDNGNPTGEEWTWEIGTRYTATCTYTLDGNEYTFSDYYDDMIDYTTEAITLEDDADNDDIIEEYYDYPVDVTLKDRILYKDGSWNTLCLPFDVDDISSTPLAGATVKTLSSSSYDVATNTLTLNFSDATTSLDAGTPYLVKWETTGDPVGNPVFEDVSIDELDGCEVGTQCIDFVGSFSPVDFAAGDNTTLFLGTDNKLYYPTKARTMGSCRAYFLLHNGLTVNSLKANGARIRLNFGDGDSTTTDISIISFTEYTNTTDAWYDLQGRRLSGQPTQKGMYIQSGKKVIVK